MESSTMITERGTKQKRDDIIMRTQESKKKPRLSHPRN